ncbi:MAG TPA: MlaD family protein [Burkholderiales bacterium]
MAESTDRNDLPQATVVPKRRTRISVVWIIPVLAAAVAVGIAIQRIIEEGPTIVITFKEAAGIEAGKTVIKYKDVNIGQVKAVQLSDDYTKVTVTAKMAKSAEGLLVEDARFWVVEPRISLSGVSGLGTLLSGNYIGFEVGVSQEKARRFTGLDDPPTVTRGEVGREFILRAESLGSHDVGVPVYFRQLPVGRVVARELDKDGKGVSIRIFVGAPHDQYVTANTRFWDASGVDVSLDSGGLQVRTDSLISLLIGGIEFQAPPDAGVAPAARANAVFQLFRTREAAMKEPDRVSDHYVFLFKQSVRGLAVGAPVEFRGVTIGQVLRIGTEFDLKAFNFVQPVEVVLYPDRLRARSHDTGAMLSPLESPAERLKRAQLFVEKGFRGQLRTGNLLTGQSYIALDFFPRAPKAKLDISKQPPEIPTIPSELADLETKISSIVAKLEKVQYEEIGADLRKVIATLDQTLKDTDVMVKRLGAESVPELNKAIEAARQALKSAQDTLGADSPAIADLRESLREITRAAASIRALADYLERQPQSLIRGKPAEEPN